jgi:predicted MFS family arabinose efflux permease
LSIWILLAFGVAPFGNLAAGWIAQLIGAPLTLAVAGGLCLVGTLFIALLWWQHTKQHLANDMLLTTE